MKCFNYQQSASLAEFLKTSWHPDMLILHYTGNIFGIGASAFSLAARDKINSLKKRKDAQGYITLLADAEHLGYHGFQPSSGEKRLIRQYWPGNLTILLYNNNPRWQHLAIAERVAVRVPEDDFLRSYIHRSGYPLLSTSVNISGQTPETSLKAILEKYRDWFDVGLLPPDNLPGSGLPSTIITEKEGVIDCLREGEIACEEIRESYLHPLILFVCTGNICRSPLAEYYFRVSSEQHGLPFRATSAGFLEAGHKISEHSRTLLAEEGINSCSHKSQVIDSIMIRKSYLILTMEERQREMLLRISPQAAGKVSTLSEFCGVDYCRDGSDIEDPYGSTPDFYRQTYEQIKHRIDKLVQILRKEVE